MLIPRTLVIPDAVTPKAVRQNPHYDANHRRQIHKHLRISLHILLTKKILAWEIIYKSKGHDVYQQYLHRLIENTDGKDIWTTVGASTDIINASVIALIDSIEYKLMKD
ncbi:MAG: hypothetical protein IJZ82_08255, partial [Lachnospiraceae bacterium]|nr:hypothetical protein [Lachnospiraceae bacterium]